MNPSALPVGTMIRLTGENDLRLYRTTEGWAEAVYHCVDCARAWTYTPEGLKGDSNALAVKNGEEDAALLDSLLMADDTWEVVSVPAEWLRDALLGALSVMESDDYYDAKPHKGVRDLYLLRDGVRGVALDAGLS